MAKFFVGSFLSTSTSLTPPHDLRTQPKATLLAAGPRAADTTLRDQSGLSICPSTAGAPEAQGITYAAGFFSSAKTAALRTDGAAMFSTSFGLDFVAARYRVTSATTADIATSATGVLPSSVVPFGFASLGGDDVAAKVATTAISTAATTQASTGYGFQPNAAIIAGYSSASSVANMSFGFACQTSDGTIKQWSNDQTGREAGNAHAHMSASTLSALALHTTNATAHDVSVTSFNSDGLELTVNATDTARPATISILGLSVPRVDAGKATISTAGVLTVTGLGQQVGLVILASIGTSLQTLQNDNCFSVGFASSNGNQRSVAGVVVDGAGASTRYGSYFNSTRAVTFLAGSSAGGDPFSGSSVTNPPMRVAQGLFAVTTDGFTVTFDTTGVAGKDVYWAALMNVVSEMGGKSQSDFNALAGPKEVGHIGGIAASSFNANAGAPEVAHIGGRTQADFITALGLTPDFFPGEGKYHGHSKMDVDLSRDASEGLGRGIYEELSERYRYAQENSSSPDLYKTLDVTTDRQRLGLAEFGNAKFLRIIPPSTNTVPLRLAAGRGGQGLSIHPSSPLAFTVADRGGSDVYIFTTLDSGSVPEVFVRLE